MGAALVAAGHCGDAAAGNEVVPAVGTSAVGVLVVLVHAVTLPAVGSSSSEPSGVTLLAGGGGTLSGTLSGTLAAVEDVGEVGGGADEDGGSHAGESWGEGGKKEGGKKEGGKEGGKEEGGREGRVLRCQQRKERQRVRGRRDLHDLHPNRRPQPKTPPLNTTASAPKRQHSLPSPLSTPRASSFAC